MHFITGNNRHQIFFIMLEEQVAADNAFRLIDAFIDKPELAKNDFGKTVHKREGEQLITKTPGNFI